jgi:outer membrane protein
MQALLDVRFRGANHVGYFAGSETLALEQEHEPLLHRRRELLCQLARDARIRTGLTARVCLAAMLLAVGGSPVQAQEVLTLAAAIAKARAANPAVRASQAAEHEAAARVDQAQAGWLPRVDFAEGVQRGDMPVYVFSTLLSQRRFTEANFAIDSLNNPAPMTNHRASVTLQHALFDPAVQAGVRTARVEVALAAAAHDAADRDQALAATRAFGQALTAAAAHRAAEAAVAAAEEDARRTRDRRTAGLVTDADVLSLDVHVAQMKARAIEADASRRVALAALNKTMGEPLDREYALDAVPPSPPREETPAALEDLAVASRPEARQAALQEQLARVQQAGARQAFLPQVGWQGAYEWNGADFSDRAGGWTVGAEVRVNVFRGLSDRARLAETTQAVARAAAARAGAESAIRLDVRSAWLRLEAARAKMAVGTAAIAQARESRRILRDRYEAGLVGVGDVLRAAQALLEAELQHTSAEVEVVVEAAALDRAVGR